MAAILSFVSSAGASVIHVDVQAHGAGTGATWADALPDLRAALSSAHPGDEVWVAQGTYTPAPVSLDPGTSFVLPDAVAVLGGFAGFEVTAAQRDPQAHLTSLSGDLLGDDALGPGHLIDNSVLVALADGTTSGETVLDGFVIRDGQGIQNPSGLRVKAGSLKLRRCTFELDGGGAVRCAQAGTTSIDECVFRDNASSSGAALYVNQGHVLDLRRSWFRNNSATASGGAIRLSPATATISGCVFVGNTSGDSGAAVWGSNSTLTVSNCTFFGNSAGSPFYAGGAITLFGSTLSLSNSLLWHDVASSSFQGETELGLQSGSTATLKNCLLENWAFQFPGTDNSAADPMFVDADGLDDVVGTDDDDLRLQAGSPAIDSGNNGAVALDGMDADQDGNTAELDPLDVRRVGRFEDDPATPDLAGQSAPVVDRGAFEFSRWANVGHAMGGSVAPVLIGNGSWQPGHPLGITITGGRPNSFGVIFIGALPVNLPFKGGVFVPDADFALGFATSPTGTFAAAGLLPANAPAGFAVFLQAWVLDPTGPQGLSATNGVAGSTP